MALTKLRGDTQVQGLSVTNAQIALPDAGNPNGILLTKIQDGSLLVKSNGTVAFTAPVNGQTPTQANHLATKSYVDAAAQGLDVKLSVRAVSQNNITLSGTQTIDAVSLVVGDRVLATAQTDPIQNGIYTVAAGGWTRSTDADTSGEVTPGLFTFVEEGTVSGGTGWVLSTSGPIVLGTTPLTFTQFSSAGVINAGNGLVKSGNVINVVSSNAAIATSADAIALTLEGATLAIGASGLKLADLPSGQVLIGSGGNVATARSIGGDATIDNAGTLTIANSAISDSKIADAGVPLSKIATAGAAAGSLIVVGAGGSPSFVSISGDATLSATGVLTLTANAVGTAELTNASVTLAKLANIPAGQIIMGTAGGNVALALSGDVTVSDTGVVAVNPATVVRIQDVVKQENPVGNIDGVNDTYVLAATPKPGTVEVYINGLLQDEGEDNDYTIAGDTITMQYLLTTGDKIRVSYIK